MGVTMLCVCVFCRLHLTSPPFPELNVSFIPYSHAAYFSTQERAIMPSSAHVIVAKKVVSSLQKCMMGEILCQSPMSGVDRLIDRRCYP